MFSIGMDICFGLCCVIFGPFLGFGMFLYRMVVERVFFVFVCVDLTVDV